MEIKEKDFKSFFETPFAIKGKNSLYASPYKADLKNILSIKNPIFSSENDFTFYTILENKLPVGRISVHIHHAFNERFNMKKCYFGYFECVNNQSIANTLFNLAESWARKKGMEFLSGNYNVTAMQEMGVMTKGFRNEPYIAQSYSEFYYSDLLIDAGFTGSFPMSTYEIDLVSFNPEVLLNTKQQTILNNPEYEFIPIDSVVLKSENEAILTIFNKGFEDNPMFVPISPKEFEFQAEGLVHFMDKHISFLVKYKKKPVAVSIHIPDINPFLRATESRFGINTIYQFIKTKLVRGRALCLFASVLPEFQDQGIVGAISYTAIKAMKKRGYKKLGITWISEDNMASLKKMENLQARKLHDLLIYEKHLG